MGLSWYKNEFDRKDLYTPVVVEKDSEYYDSLSEKYKTILNRAEKVGADKKSIGIILKFRNKILEALRCYYHADTTKCNTIIRNLIIDIGNDSLANSLINDSAAFPGINGTEIQFYRCRVGNPSNRYTAKEMSHLPYELRSKSGNYRFSIPGCPGLYLSNSSYGCWIETGFPNENEFNVSPVCLDGTQRIFNLAISIKDLNELKEDQIYCWLKLYMLTIATSYRVQETGRSFKSEYIISQAVMLACRKLKYDGVAYYSKQVKDESFALSAINLVLFVNYEGVSSNIDVHVKIGAPFNYGSYKKLSPQQTDHNYPLRSINTGLVNIIGNYERNYYYAETYFCDFDKFLFSTWEK